MKNETITRLILVLEIAAIILFHSLKSATSPVSELANETKQLDPNIHQTAIPFQTSSRLVLNVTE